MIPTSSIKRTPTAKGESIEEMIRRCTASNEPIDATAPIIYTEEEDVVHKEYDIRTDRFDEALEAIDKVQKSEMAQSKGSNENPQNESLNETQEAPTAEVKNG